MTSKNNPPPLIQPGAHPSSHGSTALRGAVSAFAKPGSKPGTPVTSPGNYFQGATAAAVFAGTASRSGQSSRPVLSERSSHTSLDQHAALSASNGAMTPHLLSPQSLESSRAGSKSPSGLVAAQAAAAKLRQKTPAILHKPLPSPDNEEPVDKMPSPGTVRDVKQWLQSLDGNVAQTGLPSPSMQPVTPPPDSELLMPIRSAASYVPSNVNRFEIQSPKPVRQFSVHRSVTTPLEAESHLESKPTHAQDSIQKPHEQAQAKPSLLQSQPAESTSNESTPKRPKPAPLSRSNTVAQPAVSKKPAPEPPPTRRTKKAENTTSESLRSLSSSTQQSDTSFPNASPFPTLSNELNPNLILRPQGRGRRPSPLMSSDNLANAIVGAHLANARNPVSRDPSPTKPPPLPRRYTDKPRVGVTSLRYDGKGDSRTPSPGRGLRQTLRKEQHSSSTSSDEHDHRTRKHKKFFVRKHPNKHAEGDRKRWRDKITDRERKRYEGVWAANRGVYTYVPRKEVESSQTQELYRTHVLSLAVKDIWVRSRLPVMVLEEIWELVDRKHVGMLSKEEFIVGLWLVDQQLKGRKLPVKVGESVWASASGVGIMVPKYKG